jgi:hypothetical protein
MSHQTGNELLILFSIPYTCSKTRAVTYMSLPPRCPGLSQKSGDCHGSIPEMIYVPVKIKI